MLVLSNLALEPCDFVRHASLSDSSAELARDEEADAGPCDGAQVAHEEAENATEDGSRQDREEGRARDGERLETIKRGQQHVRFEFGTKARHVHEKEWRTQGHTGRTSAAFKTTYLMYILT